MGLPVTKLSRGTLSTAKKLRRDIHHHPELAYEERRTAALVAGFLRDIGLDRVRNLLYVPQLEHDRVVVYKLQRK